MMHVATKTPAGKAANKEVLATFENMPASDIDPSDIPFVRDAYGNFKKRGGVPIPVTNSTRYWDEFQKVLGTTPRHWPQQAGHSQADQGRPCISLL